MHFVCVCVCEALPNKLQNIDEFCCILIFVLSEFELGRIKEIESNVQVDIRESVL